MLRTLRRDVGLLELHAACAELSFETVLLYLDDQLARQRETAGPRGEEPPEQKSPDSSGPVPQRAKEACEWLERRKANGWTFQETARRSGMPVNKLRYWARRLAC